MIITYNNVFQDTVDLNDYEKARTDKQNTVVLMKKNTHFSKLDAAKK